VTLGRRGIGALVRAGVAEVLRAWVDRGCWSGEAMHTLLEPAEPQQLVGKILGAVFVE
jgi:hypothetical protein